MMKKFWQTTVFLWKKFSEKNPLLAKIFVWVFLLHISFLIFFSFSLTSKRPKERRMIVKNLSYVEAPIPKSNPVKTQSAAPIAAKKIEPTPAPKKTAAPPKKKE
jgi:hypothetical protein